MVKYYLYAGKGEIKEHTQQLLLYLARVSGAAEIVDDPQEADYTLVSVCSVSEIHRIIEAKSLGRPVIAGGMFSELPIINELADYVWHGEAYGFFEAMTVCAPEGIPFISTKTKRSFRVNQKIDWEINPIVQVGARSCYYYTSKGCPVRCKFCMMGNAREYQKCPERIYRAREKQIAAAKKNMMPVAAFNPYENESTRGVTEVLMKAYNKKPLQNTNMVRCGYEFVGEELSKNLAKGVTIEDFNTFLRLTKRQGSKAIVYFIAGLETTGSVVEAFFKITPDFETRPAVTFNYTYLNPQNFTPFFDFDLRERIELDRQKVWAAANSVNKRIRTNPLAPMQHTTILTMMARTVNVEEFMVLKKLLGKYAKIDNELLYQTFPHLVGTSSLHEVMTRDRGFSGIFDQGYWEETQ